MAEQNPNPNPSPQPDPKPEPKVEKRAFKALSTVHLDGVEKAAGSMIDIDLPTWRQLSAIQVVDGDWADAKPAKAKG